MSTCIECGQDKPVDQFYAHSRMAAGHVNVCKDCHKTRMKIRSLTNPAVQEYNRQRAKTPERKAHSKQVTARWRAENPLAYRAHSAVGNAVRDGRLAKQPCAICGGEKVHAHHKDYSKPLEVVWLCARCHHRLHAAFPELEGRTKSAGL